MKKQSLDIDKETKYRYRESIRNLRTNVEMYGETIKAIGITSTKPLEGKTTVAIELSKSLVAIGKKVIYVDCDLRKSTLDKRLKEEKHSIGLSTYLSKNILLKDLICRSNTLELDIIYAGDPTSESTELLDQTKFSDLITELKSNYDYVIIDSSAFGSIADATIIMKVCDGSILVIEENKVKRQEAIDVVESIKELNCVLIGGVINKSIKEENINNNSIYYSLE